MPVACCVLIGTSKVSDTVDQSSSASEIENKEIEPMVRIKLDKRYASTQDAISFAQYGPIMTIVHIRSAGKKDMYPISNNLVRIMDTADE
jgi:hypothetical protein